ncbi:TonB-dependent receptor [Herminiimonas sp. KBW02]|nr:TonB-dependent receptor [Herminiimonas sp. KBW02]
MASGAIYAQDAAPQVEDTVVVKGKALSGEDKAKLKLKEVSGATNFINSDDAERRSVRTAQDILAYQPGVFAQAASGGGDGIKISIRGSAINRGGGNSFRTGTYFLFDGLPVSGPGGTPYELFEPLGLEYTEVLRGANAFDYGANTLGGAINYVTKTGRTADPFAVHVEGGSFGYHKVQISGGKVIGPLDYYFSITEASRDGFQAQSRSSSNGIAANIGYQINPDVQTRFYLRYRETKNQSPGNLTRAQIDADPRQANALAIAQNALRDQPGSTWLANKTTIRLDGSSQLDLGLVYHNYPIDSRPSNAVATNATLQDWGFEDVSASAQYSRSDTWGGKVSNTKIGFVVTKHLDAYRDSYVHRSSPGYPAGSLVHKVEYGGSDLVIHASNDLELASSLWLTTGLSAINTKRDTIVTYPVTNQPYSTSRWDFAPRVGLRYNFTPDLQVFGNIGRSVEPPNSWAFLTTPPSFGTLYGATGPLASFAVRGYDLRNQKATTAEVGTRGTLNGGQWSVALYRSELKNELQTVETFPGSGVTLESNASPTVHQGLEAGADLPLWEASGQKLSLRQAYTYSDFHYKNDARFGSNQLPGIPPHYYQAELLYVHPSGFYAGVNAQVASKTKVDYANTFAVKGYTVFDASAGYVHPTNGWKVFLDLRNLGDKRYAASVSPTVNAKGVDTASSVPGDGFGAVAGISYAFK